MSKKGQQRIAAPPDFRRTVQAIVAENAKGPKEPDASIKTQAPAPLAPETPKPAAMPTAPKPGVVPGAPATKAGVREYNSFFDLYASIVEEGGNECSLSDGWAGRRNGRYFLPLGFIPGPAVVLEFQGGNPVIIDSTPDVGELTEKKCAEITEVIRGRQNLIEGIGSEPSPWNLGFARRLLEGVMPSRYLAMAMPRFRLGSGDAEVPFGVKLVPADDNAMKVERVYNPTEMAGAPAEGEVLTLATLKEGRGPVQKMLRTWALMEANYAGRFNRQGEARERRPYRRRDREER